MLNINILLKFKNLIINNIMILSEFQEKAINGIKNNKHVLITAHTGSGKTLPAEYAIEHYLKLGKKVIYTSPIKALSNQKYNDFSNKFKDIGILTGDIKHNPSASLLIMTTEILQNQLFRLNNKDNIHSYLEFEIDIENDLACVIFDEIHYINDKDRGHVWENTIMLLPHNISFVMLSATIGNPKEFSKWIEYVKNKEVVICSTDERVVPLVFYNYFVTPEKCIDKIKDKKKKKNIYDYNDKLNIIKDTKIINNNIENINKCISIVNKIDYSNNNYVINKLCKKLKELEMFPALFFVFSRKQVEKIAKEISIPLFEQGEKDYNISSVCKQLLVSKLTNWKEYILLPEYQLYVNLLEKGIGYHHAGMLPVFREMIEMLYEKKYIKVLIATETFAVGINMPTKTVCFTSLFKHDGVSKRKLYSHEFIQMAGRAGRRNIDKIGNVILLTNLYEKISENDYYNILNSKSQYIRSKFKINYTLILHFLSSDKPLVEIQNFIKKSLMNNDIKKELENIKNNIKYYENEIKDKSFFIKNQEKIEKYIKIKKQYDISNTNKRKKIKKEMDELNINEDELKLYNTIKSNIICLKNENSNFTYVDNYIHNYIDNIIEILNDNNYLTNNNLTNKGKMVCMINEINPFIFCDLYENTNGFKEYTGSELFSTLSYFYELKDNTLNNDIINIQKIIDKYKDIELKYNIFLTDVNLQPIMYIYVKEWIEECNDIKSCNSFIDKFKRQTGLYIGEFIKCCLKLINLSNELKTVCLYFNNNDLLEKIENSLPKIMKFIITNNSLYI